MPTTTTSSRRPARVRSVGPPVAWTVLAWGGAVAYPFVLFFSVQAGPYRSVPLRVFLSGVATVLVVGLLRRSPLPAVALMLVGTFAAATTWPYWEIVYLLVLVNDLAVGFLVANRPRRTAIAAAVLTLGVQISSVRYYTDGSGEYTNAVVFLVLAVLAAWLAGYSVRERREHAAALRSQTAAQAVTAERLRIARELHDMIAHSIGVIAIQAGVGSRVIDTQPDEARNALTTIEATSRETLAGLRRTLGALRRTEPGSEPGSESRSGSGPGRRAAPLDPTPGLADVGRLAASTLDAGVRVDVRWRGERRPLPADIDLAAFRILQEALTNVVRHAGTRDCRVTVDYRDAELSIEVEDDGRGGPVPGSGGDTGWGIVGMRERVSLLRGHFTAGSRPEGGFHVAARLPLSEGAG
ncbi:sensor histidine kinase [Streptomyces sp. ISL-98]|uniref:sensor histidine kinase n=1 Tax=Streptomyces sp. ISL-98 TaxID=2819192 RepID=UPI001BEBE2A3|nr:sensor histidine kinase [Streptomyces sp. ISL-98]MBT2506049.1 sensor histidine kinase [Streptomyces sp. ISL-98]